MSTTNQVIEVDESQLDSQLSNLSVDGEKLEYRDTNNEIPIHEPPKIVKSEEESKNLKERVLHLVEELRKQLHVNKEYLETETHEDWFHVVWLLLEHRNWQQIKDVLDYVYDLMVENAKLRHDVQSRAENDQLRGTVYELDYETRLTNAAKQEISQGLASEISGVIQEEWTQHTEFQKDLSIMTELVNWCNSKDEEIMQYVCSRVDKEVSVIINNIKQVDVREVLWCSIDHFYECEGRMSDEKFAEGMLERLRDYKHLATPEQLVFMEKHIATLDTWLQNPEAPDAIDMSRWKSEHAEAYDYFTD